MPVQLSSRLPDRRFPTAHGNSGTLGLSALNWDEQKIANSIGPEGFGFPSNHQVAPDLREFWTASGCRPSRRTFFVESGEICASHAAVQTGLESPRRSGTKCLLHFDGRRLGGSATRPAGFACLSCRFFHMELLFPQVGVLGELPPTQGEPRERGRHARPRLRRAPGGQEERAILSSTINKPSNWMVFVVGTDSPFLIKGFSLTIFVVYAKQEIIGRLRPRNE